MALRLQESFLYCTFGRHGLYPQEQALPSRACSFFGSDTRNSPLNSRSLGYSRTAEESMCRLPSRGFFGCKIIFLQAHATNNEKFQLFPVNLENGEKTWTFGSFNEDKLID